MKRRVPMPRAKTPLKRKTPLRPKLEWVLDEKGRRKDIRKKPMKRSRLKPVSDKRKKENAAYSKRVKEWKLENPWCKACDKISGYLNEDAEVLWFVVRHPTKDCHHMAGKEGKLLLDETWWLPVCRWSHDWIGAHSNAARELGLLAPKNM